MRRRTTRRQLDDGDRTGGMTGERDVPNGNASSRRNHGLRFANSLPGFVETRVQGGGKAIQKKSSPLKTAMRTTAKMSITRTIKPKQRDAKQNEPSCEDTSEKVSTLTEDTNDLDDDVAKRNRDSSCAPGKDSSEHNGSQPLQPLRVLTREWNDTIKVMVPDPVKALKRVSDPPAKKKESSEHGSLPFEASGELVTEARRKVTGGEGGNDIIQPVVDPVPALNPLADESKGHGSEHNEHVDEELPDVPPDVSLQKMNVIITKRLKGTTIPDFYEIVFSEGNRTNREPLYGPWLEESGKQDVVVGSWDFVNDGDEEFVGDWCGERYKQKRTVTFVFEKDIPFAGPTRANVTHTQYCRVEGNNRFILHSIARMEGVPFSDCFNVNVRWVATRSGKNDVVVQVGLFIDFIKSTIMASKIRSGSKEETWKAQLSLFVKAKRACGAAVEDFADEVPNKPKSDGLPTCTPLLNSLAFWRGDVLARRNDDVALKARSANKKFKNLIGKLESLEPGDSDSIIINQLGVVDDSLERLDNIVSECRS